MLAAIAVNTDQVIVGARVQRFGEHRRFELFAVHRALDVARCGLVREPDKLPDDQHQRRDGGG